jgi:hypothetical protein
MIAGERETLTARVKSMNGLEVVFSKGNQWHDRIYYDAMEGAYYDRYTDMYLGLDELAAYGLK